MNDKTANTLIEMCKEIDVDYKPVEMNPPKRITERDANATTEKGKTRKGRG